MTTPTRRVVVAGHNLKFFTSIRARLERSGADVRVDPWEGHNFHDEATSRALLDWADTVVCEWCLGNAVWWSQHVRPDQRLVVRLHLQELDTVFPAQVRLGSVHKVVFVSPFMRERAVAQLGWGRSRVTVIPNAVDTTAFDVPKLPGAEFNLAMIGMLPRRKRLDRALDLLVALRGSDDRFRLLVAGTLPWQEPWLWGRTSEQAYYARQFDRVRRSPSLSQAVAFDGRRPDIGAWLAQAGWVLSPSDFESFHLAPAEGMASRALPVLAERDGVHDLFPSAYVHTDIDSAAAMIAATVSDGWAGRGEDARRFVVDRYGADIVAGRWFDLLGLAG